MSQAEAEQFIGQIGASEALQGEVALLQGKGALSKLVRLGADHGLTFTEEEYRAAVVAMTDGALSDESLDELLREAGFKQ